MSETRKYKVAVTEVLRRIVLVEARSENEAHQRVRDGWLNGEYLLGADDSDGAEFHVLGESEDEANKTLTRVDGKNVEVKGDAK